MSIEKVQMIRRIHMRKCFVNQRGSLFRRFEAATRCTVFDSTQPNQT